MSNRQMHIVKDPGTSNAPGSNHSFLEMWLQRELSRMHDAVLEEPVPDELLQLLVETEDRRV